MARDLEAEFGQLRSMLVGREQNDDRGPICTIVDVIVVSRSAERIEAEIRYVDQRAAGRPTRTTGFSYDIRDLELDGPRQAADMLVADLEEEVLAVD